jgi:hypothetical protein
MDKKPKIERFSLGAEELALGLGLINRPDLGREVLIATHRNLDEERADALLTSASHSLLARGLCDISVKGQPVLDNRLEMALLPLGRYDYLFNVSVVHEGEQLNTTLYVQKGKRFTSRYARGGVVQVLEHGSYKVLPDYLTDMLGAMVASEKISPITIEKPAKLNLLTQSLKLGKDVAGIEKLFEDDGWPADQARTLAEDLANQIVRGTILRIDASSDVQAEKFVEMPRRSLLLLRGKKRTWVFEFSSAEDNAEGTGKIASKETFDATVAAFML